jgi:cytochrome c556
MRKTWILATAATAGLLLASFGANRLGAADDKVPTIEDIMKKVNKPRVGLHSDVGNALKAATVNWDTIQAKTKEYATMADFLGKNDPPKGTKASWEKLTKTYADDAKALNAAAEKMDKATVTSLHKKLSGECMACHKAHRENK